MENEGGNGYVEWYWKQCRLSKFFNAADMIVELISESSPKRESAFSMVLTIFIFCGCMGDLKFSSPHYRIKKNLK